MEAIDYKVITAWDDKEDIHAVVKKQGKKKVITIKDYEWYFCLTLEDYAKVDVNAWEAYKKFGIVKRAERDGDFMRIYAFRNATGWVGKTPRSIRTLQKLLLSKYKVVPLEMDLQIHKHWLHNNNIEIEDDLSIVFFDIETDDSIGNIEIGRDKILSIGFCDTEGKTHFISSPDEKKMLEDCVKYISKYDVISGWNSAKFDIAYIQARCQLYDIKYDWRKTVHVDMMLRLIKLFASISGLLGLTGFSLNEVSRVFLKDAKVKFEGKIIDLYKNDFEKFKEYNLKDVILLYQLNEKISCLSLMIKECQWTGTFLNNFYIGEILDNYILREAKKKKIYLKSRPSFDEFEGYKKIMIRGGYVMKPTPGYYDNVRVFDFKSMYPSIMISWNIGEDSLNKQMSYEGTQNFKQFVGDREIEDIPILEIYDFLKEQKKLLDPEDKHFQTGNNAFFYKEKHSLIPNLVQQLLDQRKTFKKKLDNLQIDTDDYRTARAAQEVVKEMANSIFGITADKSSRYFNLFICEAITLTGQFLNRMCMELARKREVASLYGDTDSFFLHIDDDEHAEEFAKHLNEDLAQFLDEYFGIKKSIVFVEYEKKFAKMILLSKKKYTGRLTWMDGKVIDNIFTRGLENVKKDTIGYTKRNITRLIEMIVKENADQPTTLAWIEERKKEIAEGTIEAKDLSITVRIAKSPSKYKTKLLHVRIADDLINTGFLQDIVEGKTNAARITYIVTSTKGGVDGVEASKFAGEWDREYYWDTKIFAPFKRVLEVVYPEEDWSRFSFKEEARREKKNKNQLSLF